MYLDIVPVDTIYKVYMFDSAAIKVEQSTRTVWQVLQFRIAQVYRNVVPRSIIAAGRNFYRARINRIIDNINGVIERCDSPICEWIAAITRAFVSRMNLLEFSSNCRGRRKG